MTGLLLVVAVAAPGESEFEIAGLTTGNVGVGVLGFGFVVGTVGKGVVMSVWVVEMEAEKNSSSSWLSCFLCARTNRLSLKPEPDN